MKKKFKILVLLGLPIIIIYSIFRGIEEIWALLFIGLAYISWTFVLLDTLKIEPTKNELKLFKNNIEYLMSEYIKGNYKKFDFGQQYKYNKESISLGSIIIDENNENILYYQTFFQFDKGLESPDIRKFKTKDIIDCKIIGDKKKGIKLNLENDDYPSITLIFNKNESLENIHNIFNHLVNFISEKK